MPDINLKDGTGQTINTILSMMTSLAENIKIKFNMETSSIEVLASDRSIDINIYGSFPAKNIEKTRSFSMEINRLKLLLHKKSQITLELRKGTLNYHYGKTSGSVETENCSKDWTFPILSKSNAIEFNTYLMKWAQLVRLKSVFSNDIENNLFVTYKIKENKLYLTSADNFQVSYLCLSDVALLWNKDFELVIPFKYVDYAKKFSKLYLLDKDQNFFLVTDNVAIELPIYAIDQTLINFKSISAHVDTVRDFDGVIINQEELKDFIHSSLTIKEADSSITIQIEAKSGKIAFYIETKHGKTRYETDTKYKQNFSIKVSLAILESLLDKIENSSICKMKVNNNILSMVTQTDEIYLNMSTYGMS